MTAPRDVQAELFHRVSRAQSLREVLSDRGWHSGPELVRRVGHRFSAAILLVRNGRDGGPPWEVVRERLVSDGSRWRYRYVGPGKAQRPESLKAKVARLETENAELRRMLREVLQ